MTNLQKNTENTFTFYSSIQKLFKEFIEFFGKTRFVFTIIAILLISSLASIEPIFMAKTIAFIEDFIKWGVFDTAWFLVFLGIWIVFIVVNTILEFIRRYYLSDKPSLEFHNFFAKKYVDQVYFMTMSAYLSKKSGSIFKDFDRGAGSAFQAIFFVMNTAAKTIFSFFIAVIVLFYYNWKMALLVLSMFPFMALVAYFVNSRTYTKQMENEKKWTKAYGFIGDFLSNMQLGKNLRLETNFKEKFTTEVDVALDAQKFTSKWWSASDMITTVFVMISRFLVIGGGIYFISKGQLDLAGLMLVFSYIEKLYYPISSMVASLPHLQRYDTQLEQFYKEFEWVPTEQLETGKDVAFVKGKIDFQNVNFSYSDERKILKNLNFSIDAGQKIAFVGNTGAGKSTILSLLFRFWDPVSGKILLDGELISEIKKSQLRKNIGMVSQDNSLFNLTIKENLLLAKPDASEKEIKNALEKASADFVFSLENGIDTVIGERGLKLSGGEKQRLSIARIFLQNPKILILDEATSALDNKTEKIVQNSLDRLMEGKTAIIIAHRLSTIRNVDKIFMLENGEIIEAGGYDELVKKWWKFAELADPSRLVIS